MEWKSLTKDKGQVHNETRKTCRCGWFRQVATTRMEIKYDHPIYGPVTGGEMSKLDIETHDCIQYRLAIMRAGRRARMELNVVL